MADKIKEIDEIPVNVKADQPDLRDWVYQPALIQLKQVLDHSDNLTILNQGTEGACTGFALAAAINLLNSKRNNNINVSPRMLYEMARKFDQWEGESYSGSSCRGTIKGWVNMGVCEEKYWPYAPMDAGTLSLKAAKNARSNTIGAYYRLTPRISDYHIALNETGVVFCSANVHKGWSHNHVKSGTIPLKREQTGGHAFVLVGYNENGFWVQNSWGETWGKKGLALWTYEDWEKNLIDGWIFSLAIATPQIRNASRNSSRRKGDSSGTVSAPPRGEIQGHFVHIDDGSFHKDGPYFSNLDDVQTTADNLVDNDNYKHLLFYAHGGLNSPKEAANRIKYMAPVFKENGVYSYHWMYDTGIMEELKDILFHTNRRSEDTVGSFLDFNWFDTFLEKAARIPGRAFWREMKRGATNGFKARRDGVDVLESFQEALQPGQNRKLHLVGHSTGAILLAHLLKALQRVNPVFRISSVHVLAPAATIDLYKKLYEPLLTSESFGIDRMYIYYLTDELECDDTVGPYKKSLLYFVSRSFEEKIPEKILGMEKYLTSEIDPQPDNLKLIRSKGMDGTRCKSASKTHGGFDNDHYTMNTILKTILGENPKIKFQKGYMDD